MSPVCSRGSAGGLVLKCECGGLASCVHRARIRSKAKSRVRPSLV